MDTLVQGVRTRACVHPLCAQGTHTPRGHPGQPLATGGTAPRGDRDAAQNHRMVSLSPVKQGRERHRVVVSTLQ